MRMGIGTTLSKPNDAARAAYGHITAHAFGFPEEEAPEWFARIGHENLRVLVREGRVLGGVAGIPMGQWFGGRAVPMTGVAGVAVAPEARGGGVASEIMRAFLREQREAGIPLSTLYPANVPLYQGVGYERAGARFEISVSPTAAMTSERGLSVTVGGGIDDAELLSTYERFASSRSGLLRRGNYVWRRIFEPRKGAAEVFKVRGDSGCEGYAVVMHKRIDGPQLETEVFASDVVALTRRAADRILRLLAEYGSVATKVRWAGAFPDLMTAALRDRRHDIRLADAWMLRIVEPSLALSLRGYSPFLDLTLDLDLEDTDLPENAGKWRLTVRDGRGVCERGGGGTLRTTARGLAALYTGHLSARTLAATGLLSGDDATLLR
ncbi:MAG: GNAT family N-acetyltransferase, partial [Polyangiales bacterium]